MSPALALWAVLLGSRYVWLASGLARPLPTSNRVDFSADKMDFYVTTVTGLEHVLAQEVRALPGATKVVEGKNSVTFKGTVETGVEALLWLRTSLKVMEKIAQCDYVSSKDVLYDWMYSIDWQQMIQPDQTLKCDTVLGLRNPPDLTHSHFTALTIKNAIADQFRNRGGGQGARPSVDTENPDLPLLLYLHKGEGTLYRVWSGEGSMHKRGYRTGAVHKAALRETTAAAL
ncbi:hypothetical protein B484DRAFT_272196 [Ochromonadaceae sp. CCMP2298]|nr:hypothetical protein B484DRAFT_272196 [Ochromonadaceae sp. CCMP2298]